MKRVEKILEKFKGGVIAFSGGEDSLALCLMAKKVFGKNHLCVTIKFPYTHNWTVEKAKELAKRFSLNYKVIELPIPYELRENQPFRCYWCKKRMFQAIKNFAKKGWVIMEGSTKNEEGREGLRAAWEEGILSPFIRARVGKRAIKRLLKDMEIEEIPSETCLLTRIPRREMEDIDTLRKIEKLEDFLRSRGIDKVRARWHKGIMRIEVPAKELPMVFRLRKELSEVGRALEFPFVTLDLSGYRKGSMD